MDNYKSNGLGLLPISSIVYSTAIFPVLRFFFCQKQEARRRSRHRSAGPPLRGGPAPLRLRAIPGPSRPMLWPCPSGAALRRPSFVAAPCPEHRARRGYARSGAPPGTAARLAGAHDAGGIRRAPGGAAQPPLPRGGGAPCGLRNGRMEYAMHKRCVRGVLPVGFIRDYNATLNFCFFLCTM